MDAKQTEGGLQEPTPSPSADPSSSANPSLSANPAAHRRSDGRRYFTRFLAHYWRALPVLVVLVAAGQFMERIGLFESMNDVFLDTFLQTRAPKMESGVLILEISNDDYKRYFHATSPLDPKTVAEMVTTISGGGPTVIGVDLDTSDETWCASLNQSSPDALSALTGNQIVWAEIPDPGSLALRPVLGGKLTNADRVGIPRFPLERDGVVRRYERGFNVPSGGLPGCQGPGPTHEPAGRMGSFSDVIARKWCLAPHTREDSEASGLFCKSTREAPDGSAIFNLAGNRNHLLISDIQDFMLPPKPDPQIRLTPAEMKDALAEKAEAQAEIETRLPLLKNKIVLIGGNYEAARDDYPTPVGQKAGVELVAEAILADLGGATAISVSTAYAIGCDFLVGSLVIFLYFYFHNRPRTAFWLSFALIPALGGPLITGTGYWLDISTIIVGVVLHQMFELTGRIKEYEEECSTLETEVRDLRSRMDLSGVRQEQTEAIVSLSHERSGGATNIEAELFRDEASNQTID